MTEKANENTQPVRLPITLILITQKPYSYKGLYLNHNTPFNYYAHHNFVYVPLGSPIMSVS